MVSDKSLPIFGGRFHLSIKYIICITLLAFSNILTNQVQVFDFYTFIFLLNKQIQLVAITGLDKQINFEMISIETVTGFIKELFSPWITTLAGWRLIIINSAQKPGEWLTIICVIWGLVLSNVLFCAEEQNVFMYMLCLKCDETKASKNSLHVHY